MPKEMQFKVSSALKDIIGRDLINDDLIAIFELVKNSYDAHATRVDIYFENLYTDNPSIKIVDNGKGMSFDDLRDKWLFLAYSAKKDGTEDDGTDFRDKINTKRAYAGAKGIGRFSCDRLGSKLLLETTKENNKTEVLDVDWEKFEEDAKKEFIDISVNHKTLDKKEEYGTVLTISYLRGEWNRKKLLKLKDALAKLINPNQNNEDKFEIYLYSKDEESEDKKYNEYHKKVNGKVVNHIFDTLDLKTTKIITKIFPRNNEYIIKTALYEANELVYEIEEVSKYKYLNKIEYIVYFLNQSAKSTFTRRMGIEPVGYGHIFVYKNGIRIYPYGEKGIDPLAMDVRKGQGYARYLGTREVIGFINIDGTIVDLKETSSRGDGLVKNDAYGELKELFYETLKRLEKYTINIIDWGRVLTDDYVSLNDDEKFDALVDLIKKLANTNDVININYGDKLLRKLQEKERTSAAGILKSVKVDLLEGTIDTDSLVKKISDAEKTIEHIQNVAEQAEEEALKNISENIKLKEQNKLKEKQVLFFKSERTLTEDELVNLQHHIGINAELINGSITNFKRKMDRKESITKEEVIDILDEISIANQKIIAINKYATKADFLTNSETIRKDIVAFIEQYISNIHKVISNNKITISVQSIDDEFITDFKPMEMTIIIDNIINNARKAKANKLSIKFDVNINHIDLLFEDNGFGLDKKIENKEDIFGKGFTTTKGSGLGLYHVKKIINSMNGSIEITENSPKGIIVKVGLNK
jgi:signal transduction histidine kinase